MEETKKVCIKDFGNSNYFLINLFNAEKGLDFIDNLKNNFKGGTINIKPLLDDLLPLASLMDANGEKIVKESVTRQDCYALFKNPLSILELGTDIFEFQMVFLENSEAFRPLASTLRGILNIPTLESKTK